MSQLDFIEWVINKIEESFKKARIKTKKDFLKLIKEEEEPLKAWILSGFDAWAIMARIETQKAVIISNPENLCQIIFDRLKVSFAEQIKALP